MTRKGMWFGFPYLTGLIFACVGWGRNNYIFILTAVGLGIIGWNTLKSKRNYVVTVVISFCLGVFVNSIYTHFNYNRLVSLDGEKITISGYVEDFSYIGSDTARLTVRGKVNGIKTSVSFFVPDDDYDYYDKITVCGRVSKISDSLTFESEKYYRPKGIFLQGSTAESVSLAGKNANPVFREIKNYRDKIVNIIKENASGNEGIFLSAMLCGDKSELPENVKSVIYKSGAGHILAVSGAHLVAVTFLFEGLFLKTLKNKRLKYFLTLVQIWGFVVFAGLSVSVVRSAIMLTLVKSGWIFGRNSDCGNSLGICAVMLTLSCPYTAVSPSFLLSVTGTFALGEISPKLIEQIDKEKGFVWLKSAVISTLTVVLLTAPLGVYFFGGFSAVGIISNLTAVVLCLLALQLTFLVALTGGIEFVAVPALACGKLLVGTALKICGLLSKIPYSYITAHYSAVKMGILLLFAIPIAFCVWNRSVKKLTALTVTVFALWIFLGNFCTLKNSGVKILVFPQKNYAGYIIRCGKNAVIIDVNSGGKLDNAFERYISSSDVENVSALFSNAKQESSLSAYSEDFSFTVESYFLAEDLSGNFPNAYTLSDDQKITLDSLEISRENGKFLLNTEDNSFELGSEGFWAFDTYFEFDNEDFPIEIDCEKIFIRRLSYGFD